MKLNTILQVAIAGIVIYVGAKEALTLRSWTKATGTVTSVKYDRTARWEDNEYTITIRLAYTVDGKTYTDISSRDVGGMSLKSTLSLVQPGATVRIKYDPNEPWEAEVTDLGWSG